MIRQPVIKQLEFAPHPQLIADNMQGIRDNNLQVANPGEDPEANLQMMAEWNAARAMLKIFAPSLSTDPIVYPVEVGLITTEGGVVIQSNRKEVMDAVYHEVLTLHDHYLRQGGNAATLLEDLQYDTSETARNLSIEIATVRHAVAEADPGLPITEANYSFGVNNPFST